LKWRMMASIFFMSVLPNERNEKNSARNSKLVPVTPITTSGSAE